MKVHLIYSNKDEEAISEFRNHTFMLRKIGKLEFVELEDAEIVLLFSSAALIEDVFCYQAFVTAKHKELKIIPVLMKENWKDGDWKNEFSNELARHTVKVASFPSWTYVYNHNNDDVDEGWMKVAKSLLRFIERREKVAESLR